MILLDIEQVIEDVKACLPQYLDKRGHTVNKQGRFQCPNHEAHAHGDRNPSAAFVPNTMDRLWKCFACGERGTIFHAARLLEDMPIQGQAFLETLTKLADEFAVKYERDAAAEDIIHANEKAVEVLVRGRIAKKASDYIANRAWTGVAEQFEFGYGLHEKFLGALGKQLDREAITDAGLSNKKLFHDRLVWPVRDENGQVVGFASRKIDESDDGAKYINSPTNRVYKKSKTLYNMNNITSSELWVVEGYADVWTMTTYGLPAVACMGTAFTHEHLDLMVSRGIRKAVFCFDGDFAGREAANKAKPMLENQMDIECEILFLPSASSEKDPDAYLREHGLEEFLSLPRQSVASPITRELTLFAESIDRFDEQSWDESHVGYEIKRWKYLSGQMNGFQKGLYLVGGLSNIGKTHFLLNWMKELARDNPQLCVLFFTIDDSRQKIIARLIASESMLPINTVSDPLNQIMRKYEKAPDMASSILQERDRAMGIIKALASQNLHVKDDSEGNTLEYMEKKIALFKEITGMPMAIFIDNFHKIRVKGMRKEEKFTHLSEEIKRITNQYELMTGTTVELRKLNHRGRPDLDDIKESADIVYDSDVVFMLHNDMHSKDGKTDVSFKEQGVTRPILEVAVKKNKLSSFKGRDYFKLYPEFALVKECGEAERLDIDRLVRKGDRVDKDD